MESLNLGIKLTMNISLKIKKDRINITLLFKKINPGKPGKIINKQNNGFVICRTSSYSFKYEYQQINMSIIALPIQIVLHILFLLFTLFQFVFILICFFGFV